MSTPSIQITSAPKALPRRPSVSVVIPAFNAAAYLAEALDSVFAQTFRAFEVIVINDGSPDTELLERLLEPYLERIIYIKQENRGPSAARNAGIRRAQGEYIAFLDSDDFWMPQYLSEQIKCFANSPALNMIYSDAILFGESPLSGKSYFEAFPPGDPPNFQNFLTHGSILTHCVVVRKCVLFEVGLFDEEFRLLEDIDLWLRIANHEGMIARNRQELAWRRYRSPSLSHVSIREMAETKLRVMKKLEASLQLANEARCTLEKEIHETERFLELELGKQLLFAGDFHQASKSLVRANAYRASIRLRLVLLGLDVAPRMTRSIVKIWYRVLRAPEMIGIVKSGERFAEVNQSLEQS
jgi:glycosyltransferase involved in cell wall biosynthesis